MGFIRVFVFRFKLKLLSFLGEEDEDVVRERERVVRGVIKGDILVLRDLIKVGVVKGCFGWGVFVSLVIFFRDLFFFRCILGRGYLLLIVCVWGFFSVR